MDKGGRFFFQILPLVNDSKEACSSHYKSGGCSRMEEYVSPRNWIGISKLLSRSPYRTMVRSIGYNWKNYPSHTILNYSETQENVDQVIKDMEPSK